VAHSALVFGTADVQAVVGAVFDAPILPGQLQESRGVGFLRVQAGDQSDGFDFLFAVFEFANPIQSRQLEDMGETHLRGRHLDDFDAAPFDAAMSFFNLEELRGKNLPAGSVALGPAARFGCL
jgi:hypothetical protein